MSSEKNARRINLCFKLSSVDQLLAYKILSSQENKTEYVTALILNANNTPAKKPDLSQEEILDLLRRYRNLPDNVIATLTKLL